MAPNDPLPQFVAPTDARLAPTSRTLLRFLVLLATLFALGALIGIRTTAKTASGAPLQSPPPSGCDYPNCVIAGEQLTTASCETETEYVLFHAQRDGLTTYEARVCLVDFSGVEVACKEVGVDTSKQSINKSLFGPVGVNIWKVRWYNCSGSGHIDILDNGCVYGCCTDPKYAQLCATLGICPGKYCNEREKGMVQKGV